jgi:hypothetical protein
MTHAPSSFVSFFFLISFAQPATAETIACEAGDVQCLIAAINQANADPKQTTIRLAAGMYLLANVDNDTDGPNALPSIVSPVRIEAEGATLARSAGSPMFRIYHVGPAGDLRLNGLTVTEGGVLAPANGGALLNRGGTVTVVNSVFSGNSAVFGGAIFNDQGTLTIRNSTIAQNVANVGGGLMKSTKAGWWRSSTAPGSPIAADLNDMSIASSTGSHIIKHLFSDML